MKRGSKKALQAGTVFSAAVIAAASAYAQQSPNSPIGAHLTFTTRADMDTNRNLAAVSPGISFGASETLGFSFKTENSTQVLELFGGAALSLSAGGGSGTSTSVTQPTATLRYSRNAANGNMQADLKYWSGPVNSAYLANPSVPTSLVVDTGTLATTDATYSGVIGLNAPLSYGVNASYRAKTYTGTTNPALFNEWTSTLGASLNARISPTTRGTFSITQTNYASQDATSTKYQQMDYVFGISHELSRATTVSANLGYRDKRTTISGATTQALGLVGSITGTRTLPNGTLFGGVTVDIAAAAPKTVLNFGRTLDLPDGTLTAQLSADLTRGNPVRFFGALSYNKQMPDGQFRVNLNQSLSTNNFNQDILRSDLTVGYQKTLNSVAGIDLSLNLSRSEDGGAGAAPTINRTTISAAYNRAITQDWSFSVGYAHRQASGSAMTTANSDSLFFTLTRDLQFGF